MHGDCQKGGRPGSDPKVPRPRTHTHLNTCSTSPTIFSQSKRSPSHPGGALRQLPPSIVPDNSILLSGWLRSQEAHCAGRSEARGQRTKVKLGRGFKNLGEVKGSSLPTPSLVKKLTPQSPVAPGSGPLCAHGPQSAVCLWVLGAEAHLCLFSKTIFSAPYHSNQSHFPGNCLSVNIPV